MKGKVKCKSRRLSIREIVLSAVILLFTGTAYGQNIPVNGAVTDATGEVIIGASIAEKGNERNGTVTDVDGKFSLQTKPNVVLIISYAGYAQQEVMYGLTATYDSVTMTVRLNIPTTPAKRDNARWNINYKNTYQLTEGTSCPDPFNEIRAGLNTYNNL